MCVQILLMFKKTIWLRLNSCYKHFLFCIQRKKNLFKENLNGTLFLLESSKYTKPFFISKRCKNQDLPSGQVTKIPNISKVFRARGENEIPLSEDSRWDTSYFVTTGTDDTDVNQIKTVERRFRVVRHANWCRVTNPIQLYLGSSYAKYYAYRVVKLSGCKQCGTSRGLTIKGTSYFTNSNSLPSH